MIFLLPILLVCLWFLLSLFCAATFGDESMYSDRPIENRKSKIEN